MSRIENNGSLEYAAINETKRELQEIAQFYSMRNKERVAQQQFNKFPISFEQLDHEVEHGFPQVLPPFLPPKEANSK